MGRTIAVTSMLIGLVYVLWPTVMLLAHAAALKFGVMPHSHLLHGEKSRMLEVLSQMLLVMHQLKASTPQQNQSHRLCVLLKVAIAARFLTELCAAWVHSCPFLFSVSLPLPLLTLPNT